MFKEKSIIDSNKKEEILKKFELDYISNNPNWDENIFIESYNELTKILEKSENPKLTLSKFYEDAFFLKKDQDYSDYEDQFSMPAKKIRLYPKEEADDWANSTEIVSQNVTKYIDKNASVGLNYNSLKLTQYGPSRTYNLIAGYLSFIPNNFFEKNDIIGSDAFSACSALIIKTSKGIFFSHITTRFEGIKGLLEKFKTELEDDTEIHLVRPEWKENGKLVENYEKWWEKLMNKYPKLKVHKYAYIAAGSDRPKKINDSSILINQNKIMIIGRNRYPSNKKPTIIDEWPEDNSEFDYDTYKEIDF